MAMIVANTGWHEFIGFVRDGARRMDAMVLDLLAFSRIERLGDPLVPMRIGDAISHAVKNLGKAIAECDAQVVVDVDASLMVVGDGHQLDRLFQNLIGNAIKYRRNGVRPEITVGVRHDQGNANFSIQDNGIGIAPEYFDRIFCAFQTASHP
ncbi:Multi-sensor signal transduction histidine kinase (fragment) [Candidatus Terasakiella magnetica]